MPREWFDRKRVGWGVRPVSWQGWLLTVVYLLSAYVAARALAAHHVVLFVLGLAAITAVYVVVVLATSRGL
ncbi:MAG: hypothetical protein ACXVP1_02100 [Thermoleophilia bacterium]